MHVQLLLLLGYQPGYVIVFTITRYVADMDVVFLSFFKCTVQVRVGGDDICDIIRYFGSAKPVE